MLPAPLFHSFGLLMLALGSAVGATFVLPEKFDPAETLRLIDEHDATVAGSSR
jgi:acyl-CoA synthetase (AMP-forming)/AMP-acid ligase II